MENNVKQARTTEARKAPSQQRSRQMVDKILQAARQLLIDDGVEALTTSRIAKLAAISVGSLYQYFPNKLAILQALYQAWLDSVIEELEPLTQIQVSDTEQFWEGLEQWLDDFYAPEHYRKDSDQWKLENELSKGMQLFKELKEIDAAHQWRVADVLARALKQAFPGKDDETLRQVGLYLYYLNDSFDCLSGENGVDIETLLPLHKQSMMAVVRKLYQSE